MYWYLIFNLFFAHIVADFYLQSDESCQRKDEEGFQGIEHYKHTMWVFVLSLLSMFCCNAWWLATMIAVAHLLIDLMKSNLQRCCKTNGNLWFFIGDQLLHIIVIGVAAYIWLQYNDWQEFDWLMQCPPKYVLLATAMMLAHKPSNILLNLIIKYYEVPVPQDNQQDGSEEHGVFHSGALIGTLERVLMIVLIVMSQYEAIGFLIAAKSILRFSSVNESEKSEYVVAGTFISFCIAVVLGLLVVKLG